MNMASWDIREGEASAELSAMPSGSVHCVVTSPPYWGQRDYGLVRRGRAAILSATTPSDCRRPALGNLTAESPLRITPRSRGRAASAVVAALFRSTPASVRSLRYAEHIDRPRRA